MPLAYGFAPRSDCEEKLADSRSLKGEVVIASPVSELAVPSSMLELQSNDGGEGARDRCELSCDNCDNKGFKQLEAG